MKEIPLRKYSILLSLLAVTACSDEDSDAESSSTADTAQVEDDAETTQADATTPTKTTCGNADSNRQAFFGDLHVHTSLSFDSYILGNYCNGPDAAYAYAKGQALDLAPFDASCKSVRADTTWATQQSRRPLDFTAVTDHSEFFGELTVCNDENNAGYDNGVCKTIRESVFADTLEDRIKAGQLSFFLFTGVLSTEDPKPLTLCTAEDVDCGSAAKDAWGLTRQAAQDANVPCEFTSFIGYEYSGIQGTR